MSKLASLLEDALNPIRREVAVITTPSMESNVSRLMDAMPGLQFVPTYTQSISQESQQQDHHEVKKTTEELERTLKQLLKPEQHTGPVEVYLLDDKALASGDPDAHAALSSAAQSSLRGANHVVAALTSEWSQKAAEAAAEPAEGTSGNDAASLSVSAEGRVVREYLGLCGIPTFESLADLVEHLNQL